MGLNYISWPFDPYAWVSSETWWTDYFLSGPAIDILNGHLHWSMLVGGALSGKSVALAALRRRLADEVFTINYNAANWPKPGKEGEANHLTQIMRLAGRDLRTFFTANPEKLDELSTTQHQYLRWLTEKFDSERAFTRWLDSLPKKQDDVLRAVEPADLYLTQTAVLDIQGQIEELIFLCRRVGYHQVILFVDVPSLLYKEQTDQLDAFFEGLELMQHDGLRCISAVPDTLQTQERLIRKVRGRMEIIPLLADEARTREILNRHISTATQGQVQTIEQLAQPELVTKLNGMLRAEFGDLVPGAWVYLAGLLLQAAAQEKTLDENLFSEIFRSFYSKYLPLHIPGEAERPGVWRGARFVNMDSGPFEFLQKVQSFKGRQVDHTRLGLSKQNTHTLAHRARVAIEPDPDNPIYLMSQRNEGYWLEHCV